MTDEVLHQQATKADNQEDSLEKFRKQLGLTEQADPHQAYEQRKDSKVLAYLERTAEQDKTPESYAYISQTKNIERAQDFWANEQPKQKVVNKGLSFISRGIARRKICDALKSTNGSSAREESKKFLDYLETTGSALLYLADAKTLQFNQVDYKTVRSKEFSNLLTGLEDPLHTFQKMDMLFGTQWQILSRFQAAEIGPILQRIENAPDDVVNKVAEVLRSQPGISVSVYPEGGHTRNGKFHSDIDLVTEIVEHGGFTAEMMQQLDTAHKLLQFIPRRFSDLPLTRLAEEYPRFQQELEICSLIVNGYDQEKTMTGNFALSNEKILRTLDPKTLQSLVDMILSGDQGLTVDFLKRADDACIPVDAFLFEQMKSSIPVTGPRAALNRRLYAQEEGGDDQQVPAGFTGVRASRRNSHDARTQMQRVDLDHPRLEYARAIAQSLGESFTTDLIGMYLYLDKVNQDVSPKIAQLDDDARLHFYKNLKDADQHSKDFWKQISSEIDTNLMNPESAQRMKSFLLRVFADEIFSPEGTIDQELVVRAYEEGFCFDDSLIKYLPDNLKPYFSYYVVLPYALKRFLREVRPDFDRLVVNGKETPEFLQLMRKSIHSQQEQDAFLQFLTKERFVGAYGTATAEALLTALPKKTDERRNAFLHNEYDRTSGLIHFFMHDATADFAIESENDVLILGEFISHFGLSRSSDLFHLYKLASLYQSGQMPEKSPLLAESGIESTAQLLKEVKEVKLAVLSRESLSAAQLKKFSPFQLQLLKVVVGKATHRFDAGRPRFETIIADYISAEETGQIAPLAEGYTTKRLEMVNVVIEFDATQISDDFAIIRGEVLDSIAHTEDQRDLVDLFKAVITEKIAAAQRAMEQMPADKRQFAEKNIREAQAVFAKLERPLTLDELLVIVLNTSFSKAEQSTENSLKRKIILRKVFANHFSPAYIQDVQMNLSGEITPAGILTVLNVVDELVKQHALNLGENQPQGAQRYWTPETIQALKTSKSGKKLYEVFGGLRDTLKTAVDEFKVKEEGGKSVIDAIPARDFTAEVSGYIADVCYTKEYPLLKNRPVTAYKFVLHGETPEQAELNGSVLVFDVTNAAGEDCLLVRGFDYRNEDQMNMPLFIEKFLDEMADVAKKRGKKHVLVPGVNGAMSNYPLTINHLTQTYIKEKQPISLQAEFRFNDYDLTHLCYVARTIS